jgi:hypothetical protein
VISHARSREVPIVRAMVLASRGYTADQRGDADAALRDQLEGLDVSVAHGMPRAVANAMEGVAGALALSTDRGDHDLGARLLGAAHAIRLRSGGPMPSAERFDVDRAHERCRGALGDAAFDAAFDRGVATPVDGLVAEVVSAHRVPG